MVLAFCHRETDFLARFASKGDISPLHPPIQSPENRVSEINPMRTTGTNDETNREIPENRSGRNGPTGRGRGDTRNDSRWRCRPTSPREQPAKTRRHRSIPFIQAPSKRPSSSTDCAAYLI